MANDPLINDRPAPEPFTPRHRSFRLPYARLQDVVNPPDLDTNFFPGLRRTAVAIQGLIANAIRDRTTLRAVGGAWSLSDAAFTDGWLMNTMQLNAFCPIGPGALTPGFTGDATHLMYLQCGITIQAAS